jgi:hypothetical protein
VCLTKVISTKKAAFSTKRLMGWKVFVQKEGLRSNPMLFALFPAFHGEYGERPTGVWLESTNFEIWSPDSQKFYPTGWHIFLTEEAAKKYAQDEGLLSTNLVVRKVQFDEVVAVGKQKAVDYTGNEVVQLPTIVARKMYILQNSDEENSNVSD